MKFISLLFVLSVVAVMSVLLVAMSADASAQSSQGDKTRTTTVISTAVDASRAALSTVAPVPFASTSVSTDSTRSKTVKKRSRAKCARITGNCWNGA